jgi:photosystem II stability/assembly factor-like uncharacterized protein
MNSKSKILPVWNLSVLFLACFLSPLSAARAAEWRAIGPYGGSVQEVERCVSQPSVVYALSPVGGMFRSTDGGLSWRGISRDLVPSGFSDLAVDPSNPNSAWLVSSYYAGPTTLFHTRDGGSHWNPVHAPNDTSLIAVAPGDGTVIYLGGRSGLFRSVDGGVTWRHDSRGFDPGYGVVSIAVDFVQPNLLYAAVRGGHPGIYVSRNAGASWRRTLPRFLGDISKLRADPHQAGAVVGSTFYGLSRSLDAGQTWHPFGPSGGGAGFLDFAFGAGRPSNVLFLLYDGPTFVFEVDGTTERSARLTDDPEPIDAQSISPDPRGAGRVLVGGLYGLRRTSDGGVTWLDGNQGFAAHNVGRVAVLGRTSFLVGNERTENGGGHWASFLTDQRVVDFVSDPVDLQTVYAAATLGTIEGTLDRVWKSNDAGVTWQVSSTGINISEPATLAVDPLRPSRVYLATTFSYYDGDFYGGLFQSDDAGASWQRNEGLGRGDVYDVEVDASSCVYVALGTAIRRSCDSGSTWNTLLDGSDPEVNSERSLQEVEVAPSDARWIYAVEGYRSEGLQRLWRSRDGGATFEAIDLPLTEFFSGIESSALAVDSSHPDWVYLSLNEFGIGGGVWRRRGDGPWEKLSENLYNQAVSALRFDARPRPRLFASTGAGVQVLDLSSAP